MSTLTTKPLKVAPAAAAGISAVMPAPAWTVSAWYQVIASAPARLQVAGFVIVPPSTTNFYVAIEVGVGSVGAEVAVGYYLFHCNSPASSHMASNNHFLPIPADVLSSGARVSIRASTSNGSGGTAEVSLMYYENLDSDYVLTEPYGVTWPAGSIPISTTAWANSAYNQWTTGFSVDTYLLGTTHSSNLTSGLSGEFDIAIGSAGVEEVLTTLSVPVRGTGMTNVWLPAPYLVAANKRISYRVRSANTTASKTYYSTLIMASVPVVSLTSAIAGIWMGDSGGSVWVE